MIFAQNIQYSWMLVDILRLYLSLLNEENLKKNTIIQILKLVKYEI